MCDHCSCHAIFLHLDIAFVLFFSRCCVWFRSSGMPNVGNVTVYRSVVSTTAGSYAWTVTFTSQLGDIPMLTVATSGVGAAQFTVAELQKV